MTRRVTPAEAASLPGRLSGVTEDDTVFTAAEKAIQTMRDAGFPARAIAKAERMLAQARARTKIVRPVGYSVEYEYAGFHYTLQKTSPSCWQATPHARQHHAASKGKHLRAAVECYLREYNEE